MATTIQIGELTVEVTQKEIKNIHLSVHPPLGRISVAAPRHLSISAIRAFAIGKLSWIRQEQAKLREQERETPREILHRESHYVWGRRCLLNVVEQDAAPAVSWSRNRLTLMIRPGTDEIRRRELLETWYRGQLREQAEPVMAEWEKRLGVHVQKIFVQRMKTRWGSCNVARRSVRLNTDLAKKPRECLKYVIVHELVHLLEPTHNARFVALMDQFLPGWPHRRDQLNRLPVRHVSWN